MTEITIENIVASAQISNSFDVQKLAEKIPGSIYNPDDFNGLSIKYEMPKIAVLVLHNGKAISTGGKDKLEAENSIKKTTKKIKDAGFKTKKSYKTKIENIVLSTNLNKPLNLEAISGGLYLKNVNYNPKDFPGLIYKADDKNSIVILFNSGKVVCTGAKSMDNAKKAIERTKEKLTSIGAL